MAYYRMNNQIRYYKPGTAAFVARSREDQEEMKRQIVWGFAGPWYGEYNCYDGDILFKRLQFIVDHGFRSMDIKLAEMRDPARRERIAGFVAEHDLELTAGLWLDWIQGNPDDIRRQAAAFFEDLDTYGDLLRVPIVTTGVGRYHRFMREPSLQAQMDRLAEVLAPIAQTCHELGRPFGIENHGDYYCSDLVELCRQVPHLGIFLDTGNTYLIGEQSVPACRLAAPYVIGTHFKDHFVHPEPKDLAFVIDGAPLGAGDVGLAEAYRALLDLAPAGRRLIMHWELVAPKGTDPRDCLEHSWQFVHGLPEA